MPQIPIEQEERGIIPSQAGAAQVNSRYMGQDMAALMGVGGDIAQLGETLMKARKQADDSDAVANARHDDTLWLSQTEQSLRQTWNNSGVNGPAPAPDLSSPTDKIPAATGALTQVPVNARDPQSDVSMPAPTQTQPIGGNAQLKYDPTGYADELQRQMQDRYQENMKAMPSGEAQRMYRSQAQPSMDSTYLKALDWENQTKAKIYVDNFGVRAEQTIDSLGRSPSLDAVDASLKSMRDDLNSASVGADHRIDALGAEKLYLEYSRKAAISGLSAYGNDPQTARMGMKILDQIQAASPKGMQAQPDLRDQNGNLKQIGITGDQKTMDIGSILHADDINALRRNLQSTIDSDARTQISSLKSQTDAYHDVLNSGDSVLIKQLMSEQKANTVISQWQGWANQGYVSQDEANAHSLDMLMGMSTAKVIDRLATMPASQKDNADALMDATFKSAQRSFGITDPAMGIQAKLHYQDGFDKTWDGLMKARAKDPSGYIENYLSQGKPQLGNEPPGENRIAWRAAAAKSMEMGGFLPYTKDEASRLEGQLKGEQNPDKAADLLVQAQRNAGSYSGAVMNQLTSGSGKLPEYYKVAAMMPDKDAAAAVIGNSSPHNKKAIEESMLPADKKDFKEAVATSFQKGYSAITASGPYAANMAVASQMRDQIELEAMKNMGQPGVNQGSAIAAAQKKIFENHYQPLNGTIVPRTVGDTAINMRNVNADMQSIMTPDGVRAQGAIVPKGRESDFDDAVKKGTWSANADQSGAKFMIPWNGQMVAVPTKNGGSVSVDYKQSTVHQSDAATKALKSNFIVEALGKGTKAVTQAYDSFKADLMKTKEEVAGPVDKPGYDPSIYNR